MYNISMNILLRLWQIVNIKYCELLNTTKLILLYININI